MSEELYQFLACDYFATGEGRTVSLLITRAYPRTEDYDENYNIKESHTAKVRAAREFADEFGGWYARGAENLTREDFLARFGHHLPEYVHKILNAEAENIPGNFNFKQSLHLNFS